MKFGHKLEFYATMNMNDSSIHAMLNGLLTFFMAEITMEQT